MSEQTNPPAGGPAMVHFAQIKTMDLELEPMTMDNNDQWSNDNQGADVAVKTLVHSNVSGKRMQGGVFQMNPGAPFTHAYTYEAIVLVINGQFTVTHVGGETHTLKEGDNMYVKMGCKLQYSTDTQNSRMYFVCCCCSASSTESVQAALEANPAPVIHPDLPNEEDIPALPNEEGANANLKDILRSIVPDKEITSGLYKILKGPCHNYVYDYEEFKYIVAGQLNLRDGTGQYVEAKAGDLMYFPNGTHVNFGTVEHGLGFFVGQRVGGSA